MPYADPEEQRAYDRARRVALRAAGIKRDAAYAATHRTEIRDRARAWRAANPERSRAMVKAYRKSNPQKAGAWEKASKQRRRLAVPEVFRERAARRRARQRDTCVERVDLKQILRDSNGLCGICKKPLDLFGIDFDHIVPLSKGGTHTADNIQTTHMRCNRSKGSKVG